MIDHSSTDSVLDVVASKLGDPASLRALADLLEQVDTLAFILKSFDELMSRGDVLADSISSGIQQMRSLRAQASGSESSVDLSAMAGNLSRLLVSISASSPSVIELLDSGMLRDDAMRLFGLVAEASSEARDKVTENVRISGLMSLARSLKDPAVQRGVSFAVELAGSLGKRL